MRPQNTSTLKSTILSLPYIDAHAHPLLADPHTGFSMGCVVTEADGGKGDGTAVVWRKGVREIAEVLGTEESEGAVTSE
ncbi:hypothetical protein HK104_007424, partial [Borealophlyctis nickersoniae]